MAQFPQSMLYFYTSWRRRSFDLRQHTQTHSSCSTVATRGQTLHTVPLNILQSVFADYQTDLSDTQWGSGSAEREQPPSDPSPTLLRHLVGF